MENTARGAVPHYHGHRARIKNRFVSHGVQSFSDYEIIELILTYCISQKDVKPIAKELIQRFTSFQGVLDASLDELETVSGIGRHSAILIKLIRSTADRYLLYTTRNKDIISSPRDLIHCCRSSMAHQDNEQFRIFYLNAKNEVLHDEVIQEGTIDQTAVYPRKIIEHALHNKAVSLICAHNHPSGDPEPSSHDRRLTRNLVEAASTLGITIHDHIVIGKKGYYSFRENGLL